MSTEQSVSEWIDQLKEGDGKAAQRLYQRYVERVVALARTKLGGLPRRVVDEEDVAQIAWNSFFQGVSAGRFPKLQDRDDLWQVLFVIIKRKAADQFRRQLAIKRGGGRGQDQFAELGGSDSSGRGVERIVARDPTPEDAALLAEELRLRLEQLGDQDL